MNPTEGRRLAELSEAVRESTLKRLRRVPPGAENWRPTPQAMSIADLAQHVIDADEWLFEALERGGLPPMDGKVGAVTIDRPEAFQRLIDDLVRTGQQRRDLLAGLSDEALNEMMHDARFGGAVSVWWVIVRGDLDHEIHHRGEINAYLKMARANP